MSQSKSDFDLLEQLPDLEEDVLESISGGEIDIGDVKDDTKTTTTGMWPTNDDTKKPSDER